MKISDPATAFRLPQKILATVDAICSKEDLTRSQVFRRSVMQYLKNQNAIVTEVSPPAAEQAWPADLFEPERTGSKSYDTESLSNIVYRSIVRTQ